MPDLTQAPARPGSGCRSRCADEPHCNPRRCGTIAKRSRSPSRRDGARVKKRYDDPATPHQRLLADPRTPAEASDRVRLIATALDPVRLLHEIRTSQQRLASIADQVG